MLGILAGKGFMTAPSLKRSGASRPEPSAEAQKRQAALWFRSLRDMICAAFEQIEDALQGTEHAALPAGRFERKIWRRAAEQDGDDTIPDADVFAAGRGGEMSLMRGRVFETIEVRCNLQGELRLAKMVVEMRPGGRIDGHRFRRRLAPRPPAWQPPARSSGS